MTRSSAAPTSNAPNLPPRGSPHDLGFLVDAAAKSASGRRSPRYSRFVRLMKLLLPAAAALLLGAILLWPQLLAERNRFHLALSGIDPRHPDRLRVVNARLQGIDADQQPFTVTAESAHEIDSDSRRIALEAPTADLALKDGTWIIARAPEGVFDRGNEQLSLSGGVTVFHDSGYEFNSPTARLLFKDGRAEGNDPAEAHGAAAEIHGEQGFLITDRGHRILFKGKARLILRPGVKTDAPHM